MFVSCHVVVAAYLPEATDVVLNIAWNPEIWSWIVLGIYTFIAVLPKLRYVDYRSVVAVSISASWKHKVSHGVCR